MNIPRLLRSKNNRSLFLNIAGAYSIKGLAVLVGILTVPAFIAYFEDDAILGVWFTLLSLLTAVLNFDLGIGNGMRNLLVAPLTLKDYTQSKKIVSSSFIILGVLTIVVFAAGSAAVFSLHWNSLMNITAERIDPSTLRLSVWLSFTGVALHFYLKLVTSILNAIEKTAIPNLLTLITNIIILTYISLFRTDFPQTNLLNLSIVYICAVNAPLLITTAIMFCGPLKSLRPHPRFFSGGLAKSVVRIGGQFFIIQMMLILIISMNEMLITHLFGPEQVVEYQIYNKIFYSLVTLFSLISNPVWSAIARAYAERRFTWIKNAFRVLVFSALAGLAVSACVAFLLQPITILWLGDSAITINTSIAFAFASFSSIMMYIHALSSVQNGIGHLKPQMFGLIAAATAKLPLCILVSTIIPHWYCVVLVTVVVMLPHGIVQHIAIRRYFHRIDTDAKEIEPAVPDTNNIVKNQEGESSDP